MNKHLLRVKLFTLLLTIAIGANAQKNVNVKFTTIQPKIDGQIDALWDTIPKQEITTAYANEEVSYTASATWQAVWDNEQIYLLVTVPDDNFYTGEEAGRNSWLADKVEVFFDVNDRIKDGGGPSTDNGHYQIAPPFYESSEDPYAPHKFEFTVTDDAAYICEYAVPFSSLVNENNKGIDPYLKENIGFDITLIDLDEFGKGASTSRERVNWNSDASLGESWSNMDNCGVITFIGGDDCGIPDTTYLSVIVNYGETYSFRENILRESGIYYDFLKNENGCDSIIKLDLTIHETRNYNANKIIPYNRPIIDGEIDALWSEIAAQKIRVPQNEEKTSMKADPTFKVVWDTDNLYILVNVPDDDFYPAAESGLSSWESDRIELYFDVNEVVKDGEGPSAGLGHYSVTQDDDFSFIYGEFDIEYSFIADNNGTGYTCEYAIPFSELADKGNEAIDPKVQSMIGFDINIVDLDEDGKGLTTSEYGRLNWQNDGILADSYNNMDNCGRLVFDHGELCSAEDSVLPDLSICKGENITLGSQTITEAGTYSEVFYTSDGCDSTVTLTVSVNNEISTNVEQDGLTLTASETDATYQWYTCGETQESIEGATEQTFTATENGNYTVVIAKGECSATSECMSIVGVGINNIIYNNAVRLFPNPIDNVLNININANFNEANVTIYNSMGQVVLIELNASGETISISTQELVQGIYTVHVKIDNQTFNYQIVK